MTVGCNIWLICLKLNGFFTIRVMCCNFLKLYGRYVLQYKSFLTVLTDTTDRSKISGDQKRFFIALSLYPLSFFANTPFKEPILFVRTRSPLCRIIKEPMLLVRIRSPICRNSRSTAIKRRFKSVNSLVEDWIWKHEDRFR